MQTSVRILTIAFALASAVGLAEGCSCMPTHPQQQYCHADFVMLARVKREFVHKDDRVYKVRVRKEFKMSEKAVVALKAGRLLTALDESLCGLRLEPGRLYVISGKVVSLKARINLCGLNQRWDRVSKRQRKGLNRMYRQGCACGIKTCFRPHYCPKARNFCNWITWHPDDSKDCQRMQGICLKSASNHCMWARNKPQMACMKNHTATLSTTHKPPLTISLWSG